MNTSHLTNWTARRGGREHRLRVRSPQHRRPNRAPTDRRRHSPCRTTRARASCSSQRPRCCNQHPDLREGGETYGASSPRTPPRPIMMPSLHLYVSGGVRCMYRGAQTAVSGRAQRHGISRVVGVPSCLNSDMRRDQCHGGLDGLHNQQQAASTPDKIAVPQ